MRRGEELRLTDRDNLQHILKLNVTVLSNLLFYFYSKTFFKKISSESSELYLTYIRNVQKFSCLISCQQQCVVPSSVAIVC